MTEYLVPTAYAQSEYVEKRSRFLGEVFPIHDEAEARTCIEAVKKRLYDARHHCWCYRLRDGAERYSDDGEPQGTAGQPMLGVFQHRGVENVLCVVTRYFGGILLGTGGLVRAYTQAAKDALDTSGVSAVRRWVEIALPCPYPLFERVKLEVAACSGVLGEVEYAAEVTVRALLPEAQVELFAARMTELTAGGCEVLTVGEALRAVPLES